MGTSNWQNIPYCVEVLMKVEPRRVLDVGVGFGRWGMIVREFCDVWFQRVFKDEWAVHIEGIEAFPKGISDYHAAFYNKIHFGDAMHLVEQLTGPWDITIYGDVLEHFTRETATRLLNCSIANSAYVLVNVPLGKDWPQLKLYENEYERHLSSWEVEDFRAFPLVRHALFHDYCGRPFGSFCFSREDPRELRVALFSQYGGDAGQDMTVPGSEELQRIVDRVTELAGEIEYIKGSPTYRRVVRLRSTPLWNAIRWVRNRNRKVVTVRALGHRNAEAEGSEVWLLHGSPNVGQPPVPWEFVERDPSWSDRAVKECPFGKCCVSSRGRLRVPVDQDPELRFLTHPWSGKVEVVFQGRRQTIDLYSARSGTITVHPARLPMCIVETGPTASALEAPGPPREPGSLDAFPATEESLIRRLKEAGAQVLAVFCPRWLGISNSTRALFEYTYPVPATPETDPYALSDRQIAHHAEVITATGVEQVVMSGGDECHFRLAEHLRKRDPRIRVNLLWHGSYVHFHEDYAWRMLTQWLDAARQGRVHTIGVVKKGMEQFFQAAGVRSAFVMNYVPGAPEPPPTIEGEDRHLGVWFSGVNRLKIPFPMLAALKMVPRSRLHAAGLGPRAREMLEYFGIPVEVFEDKPLPRDDLLEAMRKTHLSLYITFSECCPMLPLESMRVGVPCLIGPTSHLFEDHRYLYERLLVPFPDRAEVIARYIERAIDERERIMAEYGRYIPAYNESARRSVAEFLR